VLRLRQQGRCLPTGLAFSRTGRGSWLSDLLPLARRNRTWINFEAFTFADNMRHGRLASCCQRRFNRCSAWIQRTVSTKGPTERKA
jgi:hypothetical protein